MTRIVSRTTRLLLVVFTLTMGSLALFSPAASAGTDHGGGGNEIDLGSGDEIDRDPGPISDTDHREVCTNVGLSARCTSVEIFFTADKICSTVKWWNQTFYGITFNHFESTQCEDR